MKDLFENDFENSKKIVDKIMNLVNNLILKTFTIRSNFLFIYEIHKMMLYYLKDRHYNYVSLKSNLSIFYN